MKTYEVHDREIHIPFKQFDIPFQPLTKLSRHSTLYTDNGKRSIFGFNNQRDYADACEVLQQAGYYRMNE